MTLSPFSRYDTRPKRQGAYDPANERDSCGLAMVATLRGEAGHDIVEHALTALRNLEHRGAVGSDAGQGDAADDGTGDLAGTGDGAGILLQVPHAFFDAVTEFELPGEGRYVVGCVFLPLDTDERAAERASFETIARDEGLAVLGWREVPTCDAHLGRLSLAAKPAIEQVFLSSTDTNVKGLPLKGLKLERLAWRLRKRAERELGTYCVSLSSRTITYKGMVTTMQLEPFYPDLSDARFATRLAIVHSRYSTNTFPSWPLAQPLRMLAHNGEINTVVGNRNWMLARESQLEHPDLGDLTPLRPILTPGASDSTSFDEALELLVMSGRSLAHAMSMLVPVAWEHAELPGDVREFYEYHAMLMEPWDGPAAMAFTDGRFVGATLDRNGLRPGRYLVTDDGLIVMGSETGVLPIAPERVIERGRLRPGRLLLIDTQEGRIVRDDDVKHELATSAPYGEWLDENRITLDELPEREHIVHTHSSVTRRQRTFGYTEEELRRIIGPMASTGAEPLGAMGSDTQIAVLAERPRLLFDYFAQRFAQVTNPPLDSIRESVVTSLANRLGPVRNLLVPTPDHARQIVMPFPILKNDELAKIQHISRARALAISGTVTVRGLYRVRGGEAELRRTLAALAGEVERAADNGAAFVILSDRDSDAELAPIPSLLLLAAVNEHLSRVGKRMLVSVIVEAGDVREVHHAACLIGFGASAINPYLAMESCEDLARRGELGELDGATAVANYVRALGKGLMKIMSKMGISTVTSYAGAKAFEAIGLGEELIDEYFSGVPSRMGGIGLDVLASETAARHERAYGVGASVLAHRRLDTGGEYQWRREGPPHLFDPHTIFRLQHATRERRFDVFREYTRLVDERARETMTLRGLFELVSDRAPIALDEVEPVSAIVRRFNTGAMSYGSISREAHETLAIAMNRLGGRSNTGEGGEEPDRLLDPERRSAIKQVASGRFGVTSMYLTHADDIQIKMAQGAKPGEGGQLPGTKVYPWIARTRHATAGVGLISPPPHHDIYSIEDLKQLIFDLKRANPRARIHVKLVSQNGIGAVAAGVTKALADVVLVSGHDGGTGASPLNSLKHAGTPWELGLTETQQTLMLNGLRDRVVVQVDGQLKTGRDVVIAALLGAEEFGFATAPLVVSGCVMTRVCHLDTCPVGVATQNPVLRERFTGRAEHVVTFFEYIAEELRELLAELGYRSLDELIGRSELIDATRAHRHYKTEHLDLDGVLHGHAPSGDAPRKHAREQNHELEAHFDQRLIALASEALEHGTPVRVQLRTANTDRAVGTMLGNAVTLARGEAGLPDDTISIGLAGTAGQSLGAFLPRGITIDLAGDANDYVGKGLSGGIIALHPEEGAVLVPHENVIAGNVIGYGATSGELYCSGIVGERFMVRNSGATAVAEAIGDHGLEYMTGGRVLILGATGINLGAGMSGGVAYVLDLDEAHLNEDARATGELAPQPLGDRDFAEVCELLEAHLARTGSPLAADLIADREGGLRDRFTKLEPRDYAAVLAVRAEAEAGGLDPDGDETWQRILEATNG